MCHIYQFMCHIHHISLFLSIYDQHDNLTPSTYNPCSWTYYQSYCYRALMNRYAFSSNLVPLIFTSSLPVFFFPDRDPLVISSKILSVTVRPLPKPTEPVVVVELAPLLNVSNQSLHSNKQVNVTLPRSRGIWQLYNKIFSSKTIWNCPIIISVTIVPCSVLLKPFLKILIIECLIIEN